MTEQGIFSTDLSMLAEPGNYELAVELDGKTFQRAQRQRVQVRESLAVSVVTTEDMPPNYRLALFARNPAIDDSQASVIARIRQPDGSVLLNTPLLSDERTWALLVEGAERTGNYQVSFELNGRYRDGLPLQLRAGPVTIEHQVPGTVAVVPPTPEPEPAEAPAPTIEAAPPVAASPTPVPVPPPVPAPPASAGLNWGSIGFYAAIALGNLMLIGACVMAYRMITGGVSSAALAEEDDLPEEPVPAARSDTTTSIMDDEPTAVAPPSEPAPAVQAPEPVVELDDEPVPLTDDVDLDLDADIDDSVESEAPESIPAEDDEGKKKSAEDQTLMDLPDDAIDIDPTVDDED